MAQIPAIGPVDEADQVPADGVHDTAASREPLWRQMLGEQLRTRRNDLGHTLGEVASRARVSPQYLSEIERGRKEPSSEIIAAIGGALDTTLLDLTRDVAKSLAALDRPSAQLCASRASFALTA